VGRCVTILRSVRLPESKGGILAKLLAMEETSGAAWSESTPSFGRKGARKQFTKRPAKGASERGQGLEIGPAAAREPAFEFRELGGIDTGDVCYLFEGHPAREPPFSRDLADPLRCSGVPHRLGTVVQ
jgi:hypothetical protein